MTEASDVRKARVQNIVLCHLFQLVGIDRFFCLVYPDHKGWIAFISPKPNPSSTQSSQLPYIIPTLNPLPLPLPLPTLRNHLRRQLRNRISSNLIMRPNRTRENTRIHNPQAANAHHPALRIHNLAHRRTARGMEPRRRAPLHPRIDLRIRAPARERRIPLRNELALDDLAALGRLEGAHREPHAGAEDHAVGFGGVVVGVDERVGGGGGGGEADGAAGGGEEVQDA